LDLGVTRYHTENWILIEKQIGGKRAVRLLIFVLIASVVTGIQGAAYGQQTKPVIRFPEQDQSQEATVSHGPAAGSLSESSWPNHLPPDVGVIRPGRDDIADQLNRAELNRLLRRGPRAASFR
jgi:hypothetical protein